MITTTRTDTDNPEFRALVLQLDADLSIRDGEEHGFYAQFNKIDAIKHVIIAYNNGLPAGCGAFKFYEKDIVEVKRMFVHPDYRRKGIARLVLTELEKWAAELKYTSCILETGLKQPEAIMLYKESGYIIVPNYGQYAGVENSICMKKDIK